MGRDDGSHRPQTITLEIGDGLTRKAVQQWRAVLESLNDDDWFAHQPVGDDTAHGAVTVMVESGLVYTFTTRGDALKGNTLSPEFDNYAAIPS